MKGIYQTLRATLAGATLLALTACGGGSVTNVSMSGTVTGLTTGTLTLTNGLSTAAIQTNATAFTFPGRITVGTTYGVGVVSQPSTLSCSIANGSGFAGTSDITNIAVTCATNNSVGGTVTGLRTNGLVLANGADTVAIPANATSFTFAVKIIAGVTYGATILSQPAGQTCSITDGASTMGNGNVTSIKVNCI